MRDNRYQVERLGASLERRLEKNDLLENYNNVFESYVKREALVRVDQKELKEYVANGGYIHFIGHHGVMKDTSTTTPLRMVANCALKNNNTGPSANDLWPKGPNSLSNLVEVWIRWRCYEKAVVWDLAKAYQSIRTTEKEKFLRLVVWRYGHTEEPWQIFGFDRVTFGNVPASVILEIAKKNSSR